MQGASQENLWPKSSLERPVARHFVWAFISIWRAVSKPLKIQARSLFRFVGIALGRERFTSGVETRAEPRQVFVEIVRRSNLCVVPKLSRRPYQERRARPPGMPLSAEVRGEKVRNFGPRVNECNGDVTTTSTEQVGHFKTAPSIAPQTIFTRKWKAIRGYRFLRHCIRNPTRH